MAAGSSGMDAVNSPTNAYLADVRCASTGLCFIGGKDGVLLIGRENQWSVIDHEFKKETFDCIEEAFGRSFLCADSGKVFELVSGPSYALKPFEAPVASSSVGLQRTRTGSCSSPRNR